MDRFLDIIENRIVDIHGLGDADILLMGDNNVNTLLRRDASSKKYKEVLRRLKLDLLINTPTRVTLHSKSCLDHIVTNRPDMYNNADTIDLGLSDHSLIFVSRKKKKTERATTNIKCRDYRHFDALSYQNELKNTDWSSVIELEDANVAASLFQQMLLMVCDKHAL